MESYAEELPWVKGHHVLKGEFWVKLEHSERDHDKLYNQLTCRVVEHSAIQYTDSLTPTLKIQGSMQKREQESYKI